MNIAVIGAGAIGGLVAGYLVDKGEQVILAAHPEHVAPILQNGLTIEGARGRLCVRLPVKRQLEEQVDVAILATKTPDLEEAITQNFEYLKDTRIVSVQNGVRGEKIIAEHLGAGRLFPSIVMFGATYLAPGKIVHNFEGDWIIGGANSGENEMFHEIIKVTSKIFPSPASDEIEGMKWMKLFINANNCLPAILGKSMQETFSNIPVCKISMRIWQEGFELVNKAQLTLSSLPTFPVERLTQLIAMPLDESAKVFSSIMLNLSKEPLYGSILQSIHRKRPSEIDYINGEFVNLAVSMGQKASLNAKLVQMVHDVEKSGKFFSTDDLVNQTKELMN
ncbi:MAG: 2-dehydropantoate 2-reductase [Deltaproteobacteria bacterium]|nr:2-dehydropantoate 2-reductase [Deltaproteobacteria bacterium]